MVDRWLFSDWLDAEISAVSHITSKSGWAPFPEGYKEFRNAFRNEVLATDCRAFDWTFPDWVVLQLYKIRCDQCLNQDAAYFRAVKRRYMEVLGPDAVVRLPSGKRLRQCVYGIMKSGWLRTISDNSAAQFIINVIAWCRLTGEPFPPFWAMGDDVIMEWLGKIDVEEFVRILNSLGVVIKSYNYERGFAGFKFEREGGVDYVTPLYPGKHRFLLNHYGEDPDVILSYSLIYSMARDSELTRYLDRNCKFPRSYLRSWATGLVRCHLNPAVPSWI